MKERKGFVSNSSSSSFIIVGIDISKVETGAFMDRIKQAYTPDLSGLEGWEKDDFIEVIDRIGFEVADEDKWVGVRLPYPSDDDLDYEVDVDFFIKKVAEAKEKVLELKRKCHLNGEVKYVQGVEPC